MTRTKHVGLLYKQLRKDSSKSRGGMPDYLLTFIKPGDNPSLIDHTPEDFPLDQWQEWASPVWMSIDQSNVLNVRLAKDQSDERHLCPLRSRCDRARSDHVEQSPEYCAVAIHGDWSEGVMAIKHRRKFIGIELKQSYWKYACEYMDAQDRQGNLLQAAE